METTSVDKFRAGKVTLTTSALAITSTPARPRGGIMLKADDANSTVLYIGGSDVSNTKGFPLSAGQGLFLPVDNTNGLFAVGDTQVLWYLII